MTKQKVKENVEPLRTTEKIKNIHEALMQTNKEKRNSLILNTGIKTGLRISDVLNLRIEDVKGKTTLKVREQKTSKVRKVYLDALMVDIAEYLEDTPDEGYLFESRF